MDIRISQKLRVKFFFEITWFWVYNKIYSEIFLVSNFEEIEFKD